MLCALLCTLCMHSYDIACGIGNASHSWGACCDRRLVVLMLLSALRYNYIEVDFLVQERGGPFTIFQTSAARNFRKCSVGSGGKLNSCAGLFATLMDPCTFSVTPLSMKLPVFA